jgi:glycosyltransferase involved in cell wall biosynthesis
MAEKASAAAADRIICVTPQIAQYLSRELRCRQDKIEIVGNGVNTENFRPIRSEASLSVYRERTGIKPGEKVLVFVGNLARWQGIETLIDCAVPLLTSWKRLKFLIVGEGPLRAELQMKTEREGVKGSFIFTGMVDYDEVPFYLNLGDIGVAPFISNRNNKTGVSPLKVFEYMACGKPVVASRIDGLEFIEQEGVGRLIEAQSVRGFADAISDLLKNDGKRAEMGEKGNRIALRDFSWTSKSEKIQSILRKMA